MDEKVRRLNSIDVSLFPLIVSEFSNLKLETIHFFRLLSTIFDIQDSQSPTKTDRSFVSKERSVVEK